MRTNHLAASLSSVCLDIRGTPILSAISGEIRRGEKWIVLGLNGSDCRIKADAGRYRMHFVRS